MCQHCARRARASILGLACLAAAMLVQAGCGPREERATVERRDIVESLALQGTVTAPAAARANVRPPYQAAVERIYVTVGQSVQEGDVIMELAAPTTQVYYQQARQRLQRAQNELAQARRRYESDLQSARRELEQARQAERQARQAAQRAQEAAPSGTGAGPGAPNGGVQVTQVQDTGLAEATARRRAAERRVLDAQARMREGLVPYEQQLAEAQRQFDDAQAGRRAAMIRTPISGTVLNVNAEIGETVSPDQEQPVARVVDLNALKVYAPITEPQYRRLEPNDPATITLRDVPDESFEGSVSELHTETAELLSGAEFMTVMDFENRQGIAKPDMQAQARVQVERVENVLAVPADAVFETNDRKAVRVREGNEWRTRSVETGLSDGEYTEIRSGLSAGDVVLVNPGILSG